MIFKVKQKQTGQAYLETDLTGYELISTPLLNKGMSFSKEEREKFNLFGLLPPSYATIDEQMQRSFLAYQSKTDNLQKYLYLRDLQDSNEVLYYYLLTQHVEEMLPIVYTPTVGEACQLFSSIYRRPRGAYISYDDRDRIDTILAHPRFAKTKVIVVSDGERILGLGDQGAGGMGIPIGKLSLYSACAGIHPANTLPILLDVGTNNQERLQDPLYIGWRHARVTGKEYDDFVEQFVQAVIKRFPDVLLQWEDFAQTHAAPLLERYRDRLCTFNDDIQGTAAITLGALLAAVQATKSHLKDQRIVIMGAGSAGCGIAQQIKRAMIHEGLTEQEALQRLFLIDQHGLLREGNNLLAFQKDFAKKAADISWAQNVENISLKQVVENVKPTILIGVSGQPGLFTEEVIRAMAANVAEPIIFPLSNPTSRCEALPQNIYRWTQDRAIVGTGSPFKQIQREQGLFDVDQVNNCYIFPGMGLGLIAVKAKRVTDAMFLAAAKAIAACSPAYDRAGANLLPPLKDIRKVSLEVAKAVAKIAVQEGSCLVLSDSEIEEKIKEEMWQPAYLPYEKISL